MKSPASLAILALPCALALSAVPASQLSGPTRMREVHPIDVPRKWVVDSAGGGDFLDLPEAVAAARSGDLIVVRKAGVRYSGFSTSKALTVVGQGGAVSTCSLLPAASTNHPCVLDDIRIHHLPAGEEFVLRGIDLYANIDGIDGGQILQADSCAGVVWVEDCLIMVSCFGPFGCEANTTRVLYSPKVVLTRCSSVFQGGASSGSIAPVLDSLSLEEASVFAFESQLVGHDGIQIAGGLGGTGGRGARLAGDSFLFASGSTFQGGAGGTSVCGLFQNCISGGSGGIGLLVEGGSALLLDSTTFGGAGAPGVTCTLGTCPPTPAGAPRSGAVTDIALPARSLEVESPVQTGRSYRLTVTGEPGDVVYGMYSEHAEASYVPLFSGPQLTGSPVTFVLEGAIPAGGVLEKDVPVPPLNLLTGFHRSFVQGLLFDGLGNAYLTSGSVLVVLAE